MYKVEFIKSALESPKIDKSSKCILSISLGAEAYEVHKLISILSLINKTFSECKVIIGDTLNRHNIPGDMDEARAMALQKGDEWLNRNLTYFVKGMTIPFQIIRWDFFLNSAGYQDHYQHVDFLYHNNKEFKKCLISQLSTLFAINLLMQMRRK
jgi:hypothetical protein